MCRQPDREQNSRHELGNRSGATDAQDATNKCLTAQAHSNVCSS